MAQWCLSIQRVHGHDSGCVGARQHGWQRLNGETRRLSGGADLIERRPRGEWTAWGFFESLQGIRARLQGCLDAEADRIELIAVDRSACQTLRRRVERMAHKDKPIRVRTVSALVAETAPPT